MFKALHRKTRHEIVIIGYHGELLEALRAQGHADMLCCPGCGQTVLVKAGPIKRPHFAHRTLSDCPLGREPLELLEARSVLYEWLSAKPGVTVSIEHRLEGIELPHALDCWVERGARSYACFVVEASHHPPYRDALLKARRKTRAGWNFVFLNRMLREGKRRGEVQLTPTERDLISHSRYDKLYLGGTPCSGSLHYLDERLRALTTFRHLTPEYCVGTYRGLRIISPLEEVRVNPETGEFVHPEEHERLTALEKVENARKAAEREAQRKAEEARRNRIAQRKMQERFEQAERLREADRQAVLRAAHPVALQRPQSPTAEAPRREPAKPAAPPPNRRAEAPRKDIPAKPRRFALPEAACRGCGCLTDAYWVRYPDGTCECYECRNRREGGGHADLTQRHEGTKEQEDNGMKR